MTNEKENKKIRKTKIKNNFNLMLFLLS